MTIVNRQGQRFVIDGGQLSQDGANLFHSFQKFGLSAGEIATFLSNSQIRNILARVVGGEASLINGLVEVTGGASNLYLMNPAGIVFGPNAQLNVPANFIATTADAIQFNDAQSFNALGSNDYESLVGNPTAFTFSMDRPSAIINAGDLSVNKGHQLALIGGTVANTGRLSAPEGQVIVSAIPGKSTVRVSQPGHRLGLEIQPLNANNSLQQGWTLPTHSIPQLLTTGGIDYDLKLTTNDDGSVTLAVSEIRIPDDPATAIVSGNIDVSGTIGGTTAVLGEQVGAINAAINASGTHGGGTILLGGDYKGAGDVPNARVTVVDEPSSLHADALDSGDGGRIIAWADDTTRFFGSISARGGAQGGDGGFVEVSGKDFLDFQGNVDTLASHGNPGTLLLDPTNILVTTVGPPGDFATDISQATAFAAPDVGAGVTRVDPALITAAGSVELQAQNDITFETQLTLGGGGSIAARAGNNIIVNSTITTVNNSITFTANDSDGGASGSGSVFINDAINTGGGKFTSSSVAFNNISTITTNGGDAEITITGSAAGDTLLTGTINANSATANGGNITLTGNEVDIDNAVSAAGASPTQAGTITIQPFNPAQDISINNGAETLADLDLSTAELSNLENRFSSITIGRDNSTGTITVSTSVIFQDPVTIRSPEGLGSITSIGQAITGSGNATITLEASQDITTGSITNPGRLIEINSTSGTIDTTNDTINSSSNMGNGGAIQLTTETGSITTATLDSHSDSGMGGPVTLRINQTGATGEIDTTEGTINASSNTGSGGEVRLTTQGGQIRTNAIDSSSKNGNENDDDGGIINLIVGNGGSGGITTNGLLNSSAGGTLLLGNSDGGNVTLTVNNTTGEINTTAEDINSSSNTGGGGEVHLMTRGGQIRTKGINSSAVNGNDDADDGGVIELTVNGEDGGITTTGVLNSSASGVVPAGDNSDGGDVVLTVNNIDGEINAGTHLINSSSETGSGGEVRLTTGGGQITTNAIDSSSKNGNENDDDGGIINLIVGNEGSGGITTSGVLDSRASGPVLLPGINSDGGNVTLEVNNQTGEINTSAGDIISSSNTGKGGDVQLTTQGGLIETRGVSSSSIRGNDGSDDGGIIQLIVGTEGEGGITTNGLLDSRAGGVVPPGDNSDGGNVTLTVNNTTGEINTSANDIISSSNTGKGGDVQLTTQGGRIETLGISSSSISGNDDNDDGGIIQLIVGTEGEGGITTNGMLDSRASGAVLVDNSDGGDITLTVSNIVGEINTSADDINSSSNTGSGGRVELTTQGGQITTNAIESRSIDGDQPLVDKGGEIEIEVNNGTGGIETQGELNSSAGSAAGAGDDGDGGSVTLTVNNADGAITSADIIDSSADTGSGGTVRLTTQGGSITTHAIDSSSANGGADKRGGNIALDVAAGSGNIQTVTGDFTSSGYRGDGGTIDLTVESGTITTNTLDSRSRSGTGMGGNVTLDAGGNIQTRSILANAAAGLAGMVKATSTSGFFETQGQPIDASGGLGGLVDLDALTLIRTGPIDARSRSGNPGRDINLTANEIDLVGGARSVRSNDATIVLEPTTPGTDIQVGSSNNGTSALDLTVGDLATLQDGFRRIIISRPDSTGTVTLDNAVANSGAVPLKDPTSVVGGTTLVAPDQSTIWEINGTDRGHLNSIFVRTLDFANVENLIASNADDTFNFRGNGAISGNLEGRDGNLLLEGNEIDYGGDLSGTGQLTLQPENPAQAIQIGGTDSGSGSILDLTGEEISSILDGFESISIGHGDSSGTITQTGDVAFQDPVTLRAPVGAGAIDQTSGSFTGTDNSTIILRASQDVKLGDISNPGRSVTATSDNGSITIGNLDTTGPSGGDVTFTAINGDIQVTTIRAEGSSGSGGNVHLNTRHFVRVPGSFINQNGVNASISTVGTGGGGPVLIEHGGGPANEPFVVGDAFAINGTASTITSGEFSIFPIKAFPGTFRIGNVELRTFKESPTCPPVCEVAPEQPFVSLVPELDQSQTLLQGVRARANIRPALVYVDFTPEDNAISPGALIRESIRTEEHRRNLPPESPQRQDRFEAADQPSTGAEFDPKDTDYLELILELPKQSPLRIPLRHVTRQQVREKVRSLQREVNHPSELNPKSYREPAEQLYQWLIEPLKKPLRDYLPDQAEEPVSLAFIMAKELRALPIAALYDRNANKFVVEQYSVGLMPSISLTDTGFADIRDMRVLAMGQTTFQGQRSLPAVSLELEGIEKLWDTTVLKDDKFTQKNLEKERRQRSFGILHLATHANIPPGPFENSYIRFKDGNLKFDEIHQLGLGDPAIELLVLSACETASHNPDATLGFAGIAFQAGVRSVLASLWEVDDIATTGLMIGFYRHLLDASAPVKAEALKRAQRAMIEGKVYLMDGKLYFTDSREVIDLPKEWEDYKNQDFSHPFYWSPFTIVGNPW